MTTMGFYKDYVLPKLIHKTCQTNPNRKQREKIVPFAFGKVLELGIGSGLNLPYYDQAKVTHVTGIDPSLSIWKQNEHNLEQFSFDFEFIEAGAEQLPMPKNSFDSILVTYSLCTIRNLEAAFSECRRVLKSNGKLFFCEHGLSPDRSVARKQNIINPVWRMVGGGCNLNRNIPELIAENGFEIHNLQTMYIPGWKPACYNFWGMAESK